MAAADEVTVEDLTDDPHPHWHLLRAQAPVAWVPALQGWVVTGYHLAASVLRDAATFTVDDPRFSTGQLFGPSMLSTDGAAHARFRAAFAGAFKPAQIRSQFAGFIEGTLDRLMDGASSPTEVRRAIAGPLAVAVMARVLGLARLQPAMLLDWYAQLAAGVNRLSVGQPAGQDAVAAHSALSDELARAFRQHRALVTSNGLSLDEAVANAGILLFGGIETTEGMIALAVWHLLAEPAGLARVSAEPGLIDVAVEESLRLEPAATRVDRYATRDVDLGGVKIASGSLVIVSLAAANRDPAVFSEPDRFDLSRQNSHRNLALAAGPHFCLGAHLTRLQTRTVLQRIARQWPSAELDQARSTQPVGLVFRKPDRVIVRH
ncbi:MAG TPA: cytochrome P450 [Jatrophihabitans sp.]|nr:cytochrome P450 [Jatrophihabitans sp.]